MSAEYKSIDLVKEESKPTRSIEKANIVSMLPYVGTLVFLGLWLVLCYNANLFVKEALISTLIIVASIIFHFSNWQNVVDITIEQSETKKP